MLSTYIGTDTEALLCPSSAQDFIKTDYHTLYSVLRLPRNGLWVT